MSQSVLLRQSGSIIAQNRAIDSSVKLLRGIGEAGGARVTRQEKSRPPANPEVGAIGKLADLSHELFHHYCKYTEVEGRKA